MISSFAVPTWAGSGRYVNQGSSYVAGSGVGERDPGSSIACARSADIFATIRARGPKAQIVRVDYVQVVSPSATCPDRAPFTAADQTRAFTTHVRLTRIMAGATRANSVDLLPVAALSVGHEFCSAHPWVFGYDSTPAQNLGFPHAQDHPSGRAMAVVTFALDRTLSSH